MVISFRRSDDTIAFQAYKNAIESADKNTAFELSDYCVNNSGEATSFHEFKVDFEKHVMNLENRYVCIIKKCPKMYRNYRAYMREQCCRQNTPWPIAFYAFWKKYMGAKLHREFVVFNEDGMKKVHNFYKWLDADSAEVSNKKKSTIVFDNIYNPFEIEKTIYNLYSQELMWKNMEEGFNVDKWQSEIRTNLINLIRKQLSLIKQIPGKNAKRYYFVHEICRVLLRFHKCFDSVRFLFDSFLKTVIKKGLEFANKGIPEGTYLLAQFYPEMFSEDCCPWINIEREEYSKTDVPRLLQISEFYNLSWCHAYWSEEYHIEIN